MVIRGLHILKSNFFWAMWQFLSMSLDTREEETVNWKHWRSRGLLLLLTQSVVSDSVQPHRRTHQAPLSPGFSRQEYWSGLPFPSPRSHGTNWQTKMPAKNNKALKTNVVVMSLLGKYPKELKIDPHASTIHAHLCSTFQKSQKVRTAQMFVKIWMHKQIVVYGRDAQPPGHVPILVCDCLQPSCT